MAQLWVLINIITLNMENLIVHYFSKTDLLRCEKSLDNKQYFYKPILFFIFYLQ